MSEKNLAFRRYRAADKKMYEERVYKMCTGLRRVLDKLVRVGIAHSIKDMHVWRLVLDFDPEPIIFSLGRGDDEFMIDVIAEEIKGRVVRELKTLNIQRPEDLGLER
jgi:hypothetical protein